MGTSEEQQTRATPAPGEAEALELGTMQSRPSSLSQRDPESSPLAWLCVLGSFLFLYPSYGKRTMTQAFSSDSMLMIAARVHAVRGNRPVTSSA